MPLSAPNWTAGGRCPTGGAFESYSDCRIPDSLRQVRAQIRIPVETRAACLPDSGRSHNAAARPMRYFDLLPLDPGRVSDPYLCAIPNRLHNRLLSASVEGDPMM